MIEKELIKQLIKNGTIPRKLYILQDDSTGEISYLLLSKGKQPNLEGKKIIEKYKLDISLIKDDKPHQSQEENKYFAQRRREQERAEREITEDIKKP